MKPEDQQRFRIYLVPFARNDAQLGILHDGCPSRWHAEETDFATLAELNQRADEHAEVCPLAELKPFGGFLIDCPVCGGATMSQAAMDEHLRVRHGDS